MVFGLPNGIIASIADLTDLPVYNTSSIKTTFLSSTVTFIDILCGTIGLDFFLKSSL